MVLWLSFSRISNSWLKWKEILKVSITYKSTSRFHFGPLLFAIFFNDFHDCLRNSKAIMYVEDTVVYYAASHINIIERKMNEDFKYIAQYLDDSELVINLKKRKTESMLFGTEKTLSSVNNFNVFYRFNIINQVNSYVYLGNTIHSSLNLNENFDKKIWESFWSNAIIN